MQILQKIVFMFFYTKNYIFLSFAQALGIEEKSPQCRFFFLTTRGLATNSPLERPKNFNKNDRDKNNYS
jgi:hypothetical protein